MSHNRHAAAISVVPSLHRDVIAGVSVFFVSLPLCLGVAIAAGVPPVSGIVAGVIGGVIVGLLSGSQTSISGPGAGLIAIVVVQQSLLGSFEVLLMAVALAGGFQIIMGLAKFGQLSSFAPSSVIKGLLAAIGLILILKQLPHLLGRDTDPQGEMSFRQPDDETTFSEIARLFEGEIHLGASIIGCLTIAMLIAWDRLKLLKKTHVPGSLVAIAMGLILGHWFAWLGGAYALQPDDLHHVPLVERWTGEHGVFRFPTMNGLMVFATYQAAVVIAVVASLETLLNVEAIDRVDPLKRKTPANRELVAQGSANLLAGLIGGMPISADLVRSTVGIHSRSASKRTAIVHGSLLAVAITFAPNLLNLIPIASVAAILFVTGLRLFSFGLLRQMWNDGRYQFIPFISTIIAIIFSDLLTGLLIGLAIALGFILHSNFRRPLRTISEKHIGGTVLRIELANQVSFLNVAAFDRVFEDAKPGSHILVDASNADYIDPDVLALIRDFRSEIAPTRDVHVSLHGFRERYAFENEIQFVDYSSRQIQSGLAPQQVLQMLLDGNERFRTGRTLRRDVARQLQSAATGQHPLAVVLSCIDSRNPAEVIFDLGIGDIFSVRVAGNMISDEITGSIEYSCAVAGARLVLVLGHSLCGAVGATVDMAAQRTASAPPPDCDYLSPIVAGIKQSIDFSTISAMGHQLDNPVTRKRVIDETARRNVLRSVETLLEKSRALRRLVDQGDLAVVGAFYDVTTGNIEILTPSMAPAARALTS